VRGKVDNKGIEELEVFRNPTLLVVGCCLEDLEGCHLADLLEPGFGFTITGYYNKAHHVNVPGWTC